MMWSSQGEDNLEEILHTVKTFGKACMGEEDMYHKEMDDVITRMNSGVRIHHNFCCLSVEQNLWMSLRLPKRVFISNVYDIHNLSAILVLPPLVNQ